MRTACIPYAASRSAWRRVRATACFCSCSGGRTRSLAPTAGPLLDATVGHRDRRAREHRTRSTVHVRRQRIRSAMARSPRARVAGDWLAVHRDGAAASRRPSKPPCCCCFNRCSRLCGACCSSPNICRPCNGLVPPSCSPAWPLSPEDGRRDDRRGLGELRRHDGRRPLPPPRAGRSRRRRSCSPAI